MAIKTIPTAIEKELEKLGMSSLKTGEEGRLEQERFIIEDLAPVMGQEPGSMQGKESWDKQLKKDPEIQKKLFDLINEQVKLDREQGKSDLEQKKKVSEPVAPNNSRVNDCLLYTSDAADE